MELQQLRAQKSKSEVHEHADPENDTDAVMSEDDLLGVFYASQPDYNETSEDLPTLKSSSGGHHHRGRVLTLYHQTSVSAGYAILRSGFRRGHIGFCGGGIYFATSKGATYGKAVGVDSHHGFIIQAQVDVGRVHTKGRYCTSSPRCMSLPLQQCVRCLDHGFHGGHWSGEGYDSVSFNPGDGTEYMIWDKSRVLSMRRV